MTMETYVHVIFGFLLLGLVSVVTSQCTEPEKCRNEYTGDRKYIRVYWNLTEVPSDINSRAREVSLYANFIKSLRENAFQNLGECTLLDLSHNEIYSVHPGAFNGLESLKQLKLTENPISSLPVDVFLPLTELLNLQMWGTEFNSFEPGVWNGLTSLSHLEFRSPYLSILLSGMFSPLTSLSTLQITWCEVNRIEPNAFSGLESLSTLLLNHNSIHVIEKGAWDGLKSLHTLTLNNNHLNHLPKGVFSGLKRLTMLELSGNAISTIDPGAFDGLTSLSNLRLADNRLSFLAPDALTNVLRPFFMDLRGQIFRCNSLCWLQREESEGTITLRDSPQCISNFNWTTLHCDDQGTCTEPGGVRHAFRTGATYPYDTGDTIQYTCEDGFTGGGSIKCQDTTVWTHLPTCLDPNRSTETNNESSPGEPWKDKLVIGVSVVAALIVLLLIVLVVACVFFHRKKRNSGGGLGNTDRHEMALPAAPPGATANGHATSPAPGPSSSPEDTGAFGYTKLQKDNEYNAPPESAHHSYAEVEDRSTTYENVHVRK